MTSIGETPVAKRKVALDERMAIPVERVQRASDQVAGQLRNLILAGTLQPGTRLPTELALGEQFGVSRATVREALNVLATEGLTRSKKGVKGGSFVTMPSPDDVTDTLSFGVTLLSQTNDVTIDQLLEVRAYLEVPASGLAAQRRTQEEIDTLRAALTEPSRSLSVTEQFVKNRSFHGTILAASHNTLLSIAAQPVFTVLQTRLARSGLDDHYHRCINEQHAQITEAIEDADVEAAERLMGEHLDWLKPRYQSVWRD